MSGRNHTVVRAAHIIGTDNQCPTHSSSEVRGTKIASVRSVTCNSQSEFPCSSNTHEGWVATECARLASNIRYVDCCNDMPHPRLIANERSHKIRTVTRRYGDAGCACGRWTAGNDEKRRHSGHRRHRQGVNEVSNSPNVEHGLVIHPRGIFWSPRRRPRIICWVESLI
jgi:hypothetical protein